MRARVMLGPLPMQSDPERLAELREDVARRLRNVCAAMPQDEFDHLVARIADIEYRYEQMRDDWTPPQTDRA
jgi:hypothetical protein